MWYYGFGEMNPATSIHRPTYIVHLRALLVGLAFSGETSVSGGASARCAEVKLT